MEEKRIKFNFDEIQSVEGPKIDDPVPSFYNGNTDNSTTNPQQELENTPVEAPVQEAPTSPAAPAVQQPAAPQYEEAEEESKPVQPQQNICIIDETATTVIFEQGPDISANELNPVRHTPVAAAPVPAAAKTEPKENIRFNIPQIILMAILGIIAIWFIMFTVDHSFAVNATYPVFSQLEAKYADGSKSFKGIGYSVQFTYDEAGNLSQSCNPFWKSGPNDGRTDEV